MAPAPFQTPRTTNPEGLVAQRIQKDQEFGASEEPDSNR